MPDREPKLDERKADKTPDPADLKVTTPKKRKRRRKK
jgi:hypothetical protein